MKQAKVLSRAEFQRVLAVVEAGNHAARNKCALYLTHLAGLRVKEVAALTVSDVYGDGGSVHSEITLRPHQTKGNSTRSVVVGSRLRKLLADYYQELPKTDPQLPLIYSQKSYRAFSPNSLCQLFGRMYETAGLKGATVVPLIVSPPVSRLISR